MNAESGAAPELEETKETGGGVRFGGVRVRKHRMTLGDNPGASLLVFAVAMIRISSNQNAHLVNALTD